MATEEQTTYDTLVGISGQVGGKIRVGQYIQISNRQVQKLSFPLKKLNAPSGNVTFTVRQEDDTVLLSKVWGDASALPATTTWEEVTFTTPAIIDEWVRMCVEFSGGDGSNQVALSISSTNQKDNEVEHYYISSWVSGSPSDCAYIYTYDDEVAPTVTTQICTNVGPETATGNGNVTSLGTGSVTAHGHCWNTTGTPTLSDNYVDNGAKAATGAFTSAMSGLSPNTTYYVRAFATSEYGTSYGSQITLITQRGSYRPGIYSRYWVWVDWEDDDDFSGTYDDITADVIDVPTIIYGKDRELDEAVSACLELIVDNSTHKYSPPNTSSVLNSGSNTLRSGHRIMLGQNYPFDNFTDANDTGIESHQVPYDSSFTWSEESGTFLIDTNAIKETGGAGGIAVLDFGESDAHVQVKFTKGADNDGILVLRYDDTDNYLYVRTTSTDLELRKVVASADSLIDGETFAWTVGQTKTVKVVLHGDFIWVLVDLVQVIPAVRRTSGALTNDNFNETKTKHGIGGPSTHTDSRWDDFGGAYSLFYGTIDKIIPRPIQKTALIKASDDMKVMAQTKLFRRAYSYGADTHMKGFAEDITVNIPSIPQLGELYDLGQTVVADPHKTWWNISALDVWRKIEREENGLAYQDQDGLWRFEGRTHRSTTPHDGSRCTFYPTYATNNLGFIDLKWITGEDDVKNYVTVSAQKALWSAYYENVEVWRCLEADVVDGSIAESELSVPADSSVILFMESLDFDSIEDLITPTTSSNVYKIEGVVNNGPFLLGESVLGIGSGKAGVVVEVGGGYILANQATGAFLNTDTIQGVTSGATMVGGTNTYKIAGTITGQFIIGEQVTTDVSEESGYCRAVGGNYIMLTNCTGAFNEGDTFTGAVSTAELNGGATITQYGALTITNIADYAANAAADGSGADMTSDLTVALAYPFYGSYGKGAKVTLTNGDVTDPLYVTRLIVRGDGYKLRPRLTAYAEDTTSQGKYGTHSYNIDADLLLTLSEAQALATDIETKEDDPRATVQIELINGTKETLIKILSLKLSDRITINYSAMGINEAFYINKIEYAISEGGLITRAVLTLEEVS